MDDDYGHPREKQRSNLPPKVSHGNNNRRKGSRDFNELFEGDQNDPYIPPARSQRSLRNSQKSFRSQKSNQSNMKYIPCNVSIDGKKQYHRNKEFEGSVDHQDDMDENISVGLRKFEMRSHNEHQSQKRARDAENEAERAKDRYDSIKAAHQKEVADYKKMIID